MPTTDSKVRLSSYTVAHFADEIIRNWINKLTMVASNTLNLRGSHRILKKLVVTEARALAATIIIFMHIYSPALN